MKLSKEQQFLLSTFGTYKLGNCKKCNKRDDLNINITGVRNAQNNYTTNECRQSKCMMITALNWFRLKEKDEMSVKAGTSKGEILRRVQKGSFVGITHEKIVPPWVIRYSDRTVNENGEEKVNKMWYNTANGVAGKNIYSIIEIVGDIIICWRGGDSDNVEIYSTYCRDKNIVNELGEVSIPIQSKGIHIEQGVNVVIASIQDKTSNRTMTGLISKYGDIIVIPKTTVKYILRESDGMLVQLDNERFMRLSNRFDVITKSKDLIAIKIT